MTRTPGKRKTKKARECEACAASAALQKKRYLANQIIDRLLAREEDAVRHMRHRNHQTGRLYPVREVVTK